MGTINKIISYFRKKKLENTRLNMRELFIKKVETNYPFYKLSEVKNFENISNRSFNEIFLSSLPFSRRLLEKGICQIDENIKNEIYFNDIDQVHYLSFSNSPQQYAQIRALIPGFVKVKNCFLYFFENDKSPRVIFSDAKILDDIQTNELIEYDLKALNKYFNFCNLDAYEYIINNNVQKFFTSEFLEKIKNSKMRYMPFEFFITLSKEQQDTILDNPKIFKLANQVLNIINKNYFNEYQQNFSNSIASFAYAIGCFDKDDNIRQKGCEFLKEQLINFKDFQYSDLCKSCIDLELNGYKPEYAKLVMDKNNFNALLKASATGGNYIFSNIYNYYDIVKLTSTSNKGSQHQLVPTVGKFISYFNANKFFIFDKKKYGAVAKEIGKFYDQQIYLNKAIAIMQEYEKNEIEQNLLGFHLVEKIEHLKKPEQCEMQNSDSPAQPKSEYSKLLESLSSNNLHYDWLPKNNPKNLTLGKYCSCCSHIAGIGASIAKASILNPNTQNLCIMNRQETPIAKGTFTLFDGENNTKYGMFNTFSVRDHNILSGEMKELILNKFLDGTNAFVEQYNIQHPDQPLTQILVGSSVNRLNSVLTDYPKDRILQGLNFTKYADRRDDELPYDGDWQLDKRYVLLKTNLKENSTPKGIEK